MMGKAISAPNNILNGLSASLETLSNGEYQNYWENGGTVEKNNANRIKEDLENFRRAFVESATDYLTATLQNQGQRFQVALQECADHLIVPLQKAAQSAVKKMPDFSGLATIFEGKIKLPPFILSENLQATGLRLEEDIITETRYKKEANTFLGLSFFGLLGSKTIAYEIEKEALEIPSLGSIIEELRNDRNIREALISVLKNYVNEIQSEFSSQLQERIQKGKSQYQNAFEESLQLNEQKREEKSRLISHFEREINTLNQEGRECF